MSKQELSVAIKEPEKKELLEWFEKLDLNMLKNVAEAIRMMVCAFEGRPIDASDVITRLINVKNIVERSRFPTYPLLAKQVYLRLIALYNPQGYPCKDWADLEAEALVAYKGLNWDAYVEMAKASQVPGEQQQFYFGTTQPQKAEVPQPKRRFWQKGKPKEQSEFENE
jgi:hypothetical protein